MSYDFICIGDTTLDIFIKPEKAESCSLDKKTICFNLGDKVGVEKVEYSLGGTGCNVAVGLKRLGANSGLVSFRGADIMGQKIQELLDKENIALADFKIKDKIHSTYSFIFHGDHDRTIFVYYNYDIPNFHLGKIKKTRWLYFGALTSGYIKDAVALISEKNTKIAFNPSKHQLAEKTKEFLLLLKLAEVVIINKEEAEILLDSRFPLRIKDIYQRLTDLELKNCIITDGANGAYARDSEKNIWHIPTMKCEVKETTGAGDAFSSGFLAKFFSLSSSSRKRSASTSGIQTIENLKESLQYGIINSAKVIEKIGAQAGLLTRTELEKLAKKAPKVCKI